MEKKNKLIRKLFCYCRKSLNYGKLALFLFYYVVPKLFVQINTTAFNTEIKKLKLSVKKQDPEGY